ncbi:MAG: manganese transporter permease [Candidatus Riflebacteria bacterium]|nr:manganese transporter permease [Candidatus Riflebacteria bacterium]
MGAFISRWFTFFQERFELIGTTLTIAAFFGANAIVAIGKPQLLATPYPKLFSAFALIWLVFLHMRLFDEVKDYAFDSEHNPGRPLARGLISLGEFGLVTLLVIITEILLAAFNGRETFAAYTILLAFTLLMRMEFFIGDWLRPKLEAYAISHTFSASLLGLTTGAAICGVYPFDLDRSFLIFALGNWFIFNVFEFGRKTFGKEEERVGVDSYSERLRPVGAFALLFANLVIGVALCLLSVSIKFSLPSVLTISVLVLAGLVTASGILYFQAPTTIKAKIYRGTVTFFLLAYHIAVIAGLLV